MGGWLQRVSLRFGEMWWTVLLWLGLRVSQRQSSEVGMVEMQCEASSLQ